ncbi:MULTISPECIES: hypothetical protein [Stutzerimonas stutzeri group]|uniref:Nucleotide modification associated domain-containing protein n=2 Tax=Stutzerimonas stutzeri group TaxID=136846 RepID=I4CMH1_STUST|nr:MULTISPECIES: hypothetical protein [Stutzerimonas stutzeri group]AFM31278.1 hypothetical protein A458_00050 [Stutzerimonas stutzeri CCUG 29243]MCQ2040599.1 hypothetical protein [Stutzerimonas kunmingensis]WAE52638.1 hypothetical protein OSV15_00160 [Stutzerimonas frequens]
MRLFSYKMTHDTGFAPNPFGHTLTLATCKPQIRRLKKQGDWIAGFTSKALTGDRVGEERLIYLMQVGKKLHLRDYYSDPLYQDKIPNLGKSGPIPKTGDNIYRPLVPGAIEPAHFEQLRNPNHWDKDVDVPSAFDLRRDVSGQYALIADEFYYFGAQAIALPEAVRPALPGGQSAHGIQSSEALAERFISFIRSRYQPGRHGNPTRWPEDELTSTSKCGGR